jgi:hypothetical protein
MESKESIDSIQSNLPPKDGIPLLMYYDYLPAMKGIHYNNGAALGRRGRRYPRLERPPSQSL